MRDQNWPNWVNTFADNCAGGATHRHKTGQSIYMCCKRQQTCAFCDTCGNKWMHEVGTMSMDAHWPNFFRQYGDKCEGNIGYHDYSGQNGVKLCCQDASTAALMEAGNFTDRKSVV